MEQIRRKELAVQTLQTLVKNTSSDIETVRNENAASLAHKESKKLAIAQVTKALEQKDIYIDALNHRLTRLQEEFKAAKTKRQEVEKSVRELELTFAQERENFRNKILQFSPQKQIQDQLDKLQPRLNEAIDLKEGIETLLKSNSNVTKSNEIGGSEWRKKEPSTPEDESQVYKYFNPIPSSSGYSSFY